MTCPELRDRLDRYVRNQLTGPEASALETHLTECAACSALLEQLAPALPEVDHLPRTIDPPKEVWPKVRSSLPSRARPRHGVTMPPWVLAAAAVLLIALSAGTTAILFRRPPGPASRAVSAAVGLEAQYASATADLAAELANAKSRLAPATLAVIERNLRVIDSALAESRRALQSDPGNRVLEQMVVAVWRQKMDFLRRATALAPAS